MILRAIQTFPLKEGLSIPSYDSVFHADHFRRLQRSLVRALRGASRAEDLHNSGQPAFRSRRGRGSDQLLSLMYDCESTLTNSEPSPVSSAKLWIIINIMWDKSLIVAS